LIFPLLSPVSGSFARELYLLFFPFFEDLSFFSLPPWVIPPFFFNIFDLISVIRNGETPALKPPLWAFRSFPFRLSLFLASIALDVFSFSPPCREFLPRLQSITTLVQFLSTLHLFSYLCRTQPTLLIWFPHANGRGRNPSLIVTLFDTVLRDFVCWELGIAAHFFLNPVGSSPPFLLADSMRRLTAPFDYRTPESAYFGLAPLVLVPDNYV